MFWLAQHFRCDLAVLNTCLCRLGPRSNFRPTWILSLGWGHCPAYVNSGHLAPACWWRGLCLLRKDFDVVITTYFGNSFRMFSAPSVRSGSIFLYNIRVIENSPVFVPLLVLVPLVLPQQLVQVPAGFTECAPRSRIMLQAGKRENNVVDYQEELECWRIPMVSAGYKWGNMRPWVSDILNGTYQAFYDRNVSDFPVITNLIIFQKVSSQGQTAEVCKSCRHKQTEEHPFHIASWFLTIWENQCESKAGKIWLLWHLFFSVRISKGCSELLLFRSVWVASLKGCLSILEIQGHFKTLYSQVPTCFKVTLETESKI